MKLFGKKPAALLAVGSFALAMTSCKQAADENNESTEKAASSLTQAWTQFVEKISKTLRGGFGGATQPSGVQNRRDEDEDGGAGG